MSNSILTPKTFLTYSLGCRTNQAEIESIGLQLTKYGLRSTDYRLQQPDLILLNTCVVTQKAEKETRQKIRELRRKYPKSFLVVLGCAVTAKDKFNLKLPQADLFVSNQEKESIINLLSQEFSLNQKNNQMTLSNKYTLSGRKLIKIQDGCQNFCSFCLTCHLRGKPTNFSCQSIIKQINFWTKQGVKEIILTGINIGLYYDLPELVNKILKQGDSLSTQGVSLQKRVERISFSSVYPEILTDDFLKIVINNPRISQYFHLSLQSGSPSVLERMNRKTDLSRLKQILSRIKKQNPYFTFRADIIVGFPDETEEEFKETLDFIKDAGISFTHIFPYSKREGTAACLLPDLPNQTKKERVKRIVETVKAIRQKEAKALIGQTSNCLIIRGNDGITENGWLTKIKSQKSKIKNIKGNILPVRITEFKDDQLFGEIISLPTN